MSLQVSYFKNVVKSLPGFLFQLFYPNPSLAFAFASARHRLGWLILRLHLLRPGIMDGPVADGTVDEPAQVAGGKLPGRALFPLCLGTGTRDPARFEAIFTKQLASKQEIELALDVDRDGPPALLITVDGLDRDAQQLGHLFLGFFQFLPECAEFFILHSVLFLVEAS